MAGQKKGSGDVEPRVAEWQPRRRHDEAVRGSQSQGAAARRGSTGRRSTTPGFPASPSCAPSTFRAWWSRGRTISASAATTSILESDAKVVDTPATFPTAAGRLGGVQVVLIGAASDPTTAPEQVPKGSAILSEYPGWTKRFFDKLRIPVAVEFSYGGTEAHIPGDYRYGVCVTETGSSIAANGLRIIGKLFDQQHRADRQSAGATRRAEERGDPCHQPASLSARKTPATRFLLVMNVPTANKEAITQPRAGAEGADRQPAGARARDTRSAPSSAARSSTRSYRTCSSTARKTCSNCRSRK